MSEKYFAIPYIGVCDVRSSKDIAQLGARLVAVAEHGPLYLKAGVTMTAAALWGIPTEYKKVCPPKRRIKVIFSEKPPMVLQTIHYADYSGGAGFYFANALKRLIALGGPHLHAIQLDMIWPNPRVIEECKKAHPNLQFILQVGENALMQVDDSPLKMWQALQNYDGLINRVLLDRSMGKGKGLDARSLIRFVDILYERMETPGVVVAGGLGPDTLDFALPLVAVYPRLSFDAQSKLHEGGTMFSGPLSMQSAMDYVTRGAAMHQKYNVMS